MGNNAFFLYFFLCNIYYKMDCQQIILYGLLLIVAVYVLRDVFNLNFKIPLLEGQDDAPLPAEPQEDDAPQVPSVLADDDIAPNVGDDMPPLSDLTNDGQEQDVVENFAPGVVPTDQLPRDAPIASEPIGNNETFLPVEGIRSAPSSCYPQNTLTPKDLLPQGKEEEIEQWDENNPAQEGILKGVNFLDAGFHIGVNTVGQSLRNANLNLRAEPPNPRVQVSPWMNTTIDEDLTRRPLGTEGVCNQVPPEAGLVQ